MKDKSNLLKIIALAINTIILIFLAFTFYFYRKNHPKIDAAIRVFTYILEKKNMALYSGLID